MLSRRWQPCGRSVAITGPLRDERPVLGLGPLEPDVVGAPGEDVLERAQQAAVPLADLEGGGAQGWEAGEMKHKATQNN